MKRNDVGIHPRCGGVGRSNSVLVVGRGKERISRAEGHVKGWIIGVRKGVC